MLVAFSIPGPGVEPDESGPSDSYRFVNGTQLTKEFKTPARTLVPLAGVVIEPAVFSTQLFVFRSQELKFQRALLNELQMGREVDVAITLAAQAVGMTQESALKFLKSRKYKEWIKDRMSELEIEQGITPQWFMAELHNIYDGVVKKNKEQMQAISEIGDRIAPKVSRMEHEVSAKQVLSMEELPAYEKKVEELEAKLKEAVNESA